MPASPQVVFLAGAPDVCSLDWSELGLISHLLPCFSEDPSNSLESSPSSTQLPVWRSIPLHRQQLHTGLTLPSQPTLVPWEPELNVAQQSFEQGDNLDISFVSAGSFGDWEEALREADGVEPKSSSSAIVGGRKTVVPTKAGALDDFFARSFALHDSLASSQIPGNVPPTPGQRQKSFASTISGTTATATETQSAESFSSSPPVAPSQEVLPFPWNLNITRLKLLPSANSIRALLPQTPIVNLVVAVLRIAPPKTIRPKRYLNKPVELLELTVADDTRSGLGINLWLPIAQKSRGGWPLHLRAEQGFADAARRLRIRDIVLFRNVVLGEWRGAVYAQSLRKGSTKIELLCRHASDESESQGLEFGPVWNHAELDGFQDHEDPSSQVDKENLVRGSNSVKERAADILSWMVDFVPALPGPSVIAEPAGRDMKTKRAETKEQYSPGRDRKRARVLPPDTQ